MKKLYIIIVMFLTFLSSTNFANQNRSSVNFFYSELSPYGEWIEIDRNLIVWQPYSVAENWQPYTRGQWHWTSDGWYWNSYEPFGWATYHYGRWYFDDYYGWVWFPDNEWAPSWVEWRYSNNYIGWAPLSPYASFRIGVGIHFSHHKPINHYHWHFVNTHHFCGVNVHNYIFNHNKNHRIYSKTKYRTNYYHKNGRIINGGIDRRYIEKRIGRDIHEKRFTSTKTRTSFERNKRIRDNKITVYRPGKDEITKTRSKVDVRVKRGEKTTSIERSKISVTRSRNDQKTKYYDRSTKSSNTEIKSKRTSRSSSKEKTTTKRTKVKKNASNRNKSHKKAATQTSRSTKKSSQTSRKRSR